MRYERNGATGFLSPPSFSPRVAATPSPPRHAGGERRQPTESNGNSFLGNSLPEIYGRNWPSHARSDQRAIHLLESVQPNCVSGQNKKEKGEGERGAGGGEEEICGVNHDDNDRRMFRGKMKFHKLHLLIPS